MCDEWYVWMCTVYEICLAYGACSMWGVWYAWMCTVCEVYICVCGVWYAWMCKVYEI